MDDVGELGVFRMCEWVIGRVEEELVVRGERLNNKTKIDESDSDISDSDLPFLKLICIPFVASYSSNVISHVFGGKRLEWYRDAVFEGGCRTAKRCRMGRCVC